MNQPELTSEDVARLRAEFRAALKGPMTVLPEEPLPKITEIQRWSYRPGDRLIAHTDIAKVTREQAIEVATRIRRALDLPDSAPIVIAGEGWTFEVVSEID